MESLLIVCYTQTQKYRKPKTIQLQGNNESDSNRNYRKSTNPQRLNNTQLNDECVSEEIKETKYFLELNENEGMMCENPKIQRGQYKPQHLQL